MKSRKIAVVAVALGLASAAAVAGYVQPAPVMIDFDAQFANGDMVTARYSENDVEFIGCGVRNYDDGAGGTFRFGFCQAGDAAGETIVCNTFNSDLADAITAISDYSYIQFAWNDAGECTSIGSSTQSFYLPNLKAKK